MTVPEFLQVEAEFDRFTEILRAERVGSLLEIGSKFGGSLRHAALALPVGSRIVSVDLRRGTKAWRDSEPALEQTIKWLNGIGYNAHLIWGGSTDAKVVQQVAALGPFDAIFVDANHTMPYLEKDWANYRDMARKLIAFHDIAWRRAPEWVGVRIDVPQFWDSIKGGFRHEEIKLCHTGKNNGIGVLWL